MKDEEMSYEAGDRIYIPAGIPHSVINDGEKDLEMVFVFSGPDYTPTGKG